MSRNWGGYRADPLLRSKVWTQLRKQVATEIRLGAPCARCGRPIDLELKWPHPGSYTLGHIVPRAVAKALGWTEAQIDSRSNTQPEHKACGQRAGSALGGRQTARVRRNSYAASSPLPMSRKADPRVALARSNITVVTPQSDTRQAAAATRW